MTVVPEESPQPAAHDNLWVLAKKQGIAVPEWKGYINRITRGKPIESKGITFVLQMPFFRI